MSPVLRRPKKKQARIPITDLPSPPSLEDELFAESLQYPILSPPPTLPEEILTRPPFLEEQVHSPIETISSMYIEDDLTSDILRELAESGFGSFLSSVPAKKPVVLHIEELAIKQFRAAIDAYLTAGKKHLELNFNENASSLYSCAVLCVFLSEDAFQAAHLMKELVTKLPSELVKSHIFQGVKLLLKVTLLRDISYLKRAEKWLFYDTNHMYKEDQELIHRAIHESKLVIETQIFDA
ncbi:hypothetical protein CEE45_14005 [Candidatus Heimdallarchaeota archaeon B3_Heim]|nr:MAG: hypothetical protein CEE45_14005 [Candidatus Heimdallarchaeota archaeon B3_Heim]